jgi:transposase
MLDTEEWWMLKDEYEDGKTITALAKETGRDRKTVRKYIHSGDKPTYKPREAKPGLLDPFQDYIRKRVVKDGIMASRILREIRKNGYTGGYTILKEYVRPLRVEQSIEAVYRYETKPGVQAQVDFDPIAYIETDGLVKKLYCFNMILSFSRNRYFQYTVDASTVGLIRLMLDGFQFFDGYPKEILFDNMKQVVIKRALRYEDNEWNPTFWDFVKHFKFTPRLCKPGRAQTKGKVENQVKVVQQDFFKGLDFSGLSDLNSKAIGYCHEVNSRVHRTTGAIPKDQLAAEDLTPFSDKPPYQVVLVSYRKISRDCYVSYLGNRYSVPWRYAGLQARILDKDHRISVEVNGSPVCEHGLKPGAGSVVRVKEHFDGLLAEIRGRNLRTHVQRVLKLPGAPDVEHRPLSVYEEVFSGRGGVDG